jgi:hypothetical protein
MHRLLHPASLICFMRTLRPSLVILELALRVLARCDVFNAFALVTRRAFDASRHESTPPPPGSPSYVSCKLRIASLELCIASLATLQNALKVEPLFPDVPDRFAGGRPRLIKFWTHAPNHFSRLFPVPRLVIDDQISCSCFSPTFLFIFVVRIRVPSWIQKVSSVIAY